MVTSCQLGREKPKSWKASGKRIKRGLYQTQCGLLVNADINGAANILKKVATTLKFSLKGVSRGSLIMPLRIQWMDCLRIPAPLGRGVSRNLDSDQKIRSPVP
ncbi:hypothetical protein [Okeania sp. KiyG1]|uniref:hypothetical protein n=1 Tax=Okeania sp. KiyG1 TaxID=2720165 RepID=UPI00198C8867|nr:hypothetical protein [Okeania sp. KiyG1]GGA52949.1 hypothetical protein CYANOKiyG1_72940 [Okeania sp. KiyG1]